MTVQSPVLVDVAPRPADNPASPSFDLDVLPREDRTGYVWASVATAAAVTAIGTLALALAVAL